VSYYIYILECKDKTLYTGSTNDIEKRILAHNTAKTGARYTKARRPVKLRYSEEFKTKSEALKREIFIKKMSRHKKLILMKLNK
jgi:putative endonuclease